MMQEIIYEKTPYRYFIKIRKYTLFIKSISKNIITKSILIFLIRA